MSRRTGRAGDGADTGTPATVALRRAGISYWPRPYRHDPAAESFGLEAAGELGVPPAQVFKTLLASVDGTLTVAVVPVSGTLDLKALAAACTAKRAVMAEVAAAEKATGYVVGGISPFGQRRALPTVIDASALQWNRVLCSAGKRGWDVALAPADLVRLTAGVTADILAG